MRGPNEKRTVIVLGERFEPERLTQLLETRGWKRVSNDLTGGGDRQITEDVWASPGDKQAVHYVDDRTMRTRYLWVRGDEILSIASILAGHFHIHPPDELIADVANAEDMRGLEAALLRLAVGNRDAFDEEALETFRFFAQHDAPSIRYTVIQSLLFTGWRQGGEILRRMAADESVPDLRAFAAEAAAAVSEGRAGP